MDSDFYRKSFFLVAAVLLGYALLRMMEPFWGALSWGLCLAFLLHPLQRRLTRKFNGRDGLAAGLLTGLTPIVLLLPLASLGVLFIQQASNLVQLLQRLDLSKDAAWFARFEQYPLVARVLALIRENSFVSTAEIQAWLIKGAQTLLQSLASAGGNVVLGAVGTLVGFFLMLFLLFFLLRDGATMFTNIVRLVPLPEARRAGLVQLMADTTRAVVYGSGTTALAQGTLVGIGFAIVGLPSPLVFGALATVLALLPAGGTAIVWVPAVLWLLAMQRWGAALFIGLWGFGVSLTDNLLRPLLIGRYAPVSTLAVFVGVVGGVSAFGAIGLIIGPVLLTLIAALLQFAEESTPPR